MALRSPWFSQPLKRKHPDELLPEDSSGNVNGGGGGAGIGYGGVGANTQQVGQVLPSNQCSNSNGRATKRTRVKLESRNLERGFAGLSIKPTPASSSPPPPNTQQQQQLNAQVGDNGVWVNVSGDIDVDQSPSVVCPDGSTLPLLRSSSVYEPPSPDLDDIQMSTQTWYEPEKDRIVVTSLDDDEYDGDDEGQQRQCAGTNSTSQPPGFTISSAFLNAINKKLTQSVESIGPPTDPSTTQALVLFRPLPTIGLPSTEHDPGDRVSAGGKLDGLSQNPPATPSSFFVQDSAQLSFVPNDDDMEIEML